MQKEGVYKYNIILKAYNYQTHVVSSYIRPEKIPVFVTPLCKTSILTNTLKAEWPNKYTSKKYIKIFILNESTIWIHMSLYMCYHWILLKPSMICSRVYQNSIIKVDLKMKNIWNLEKVEFLWI